MSQAIFNNINPATTSGTQLATLLNGFKDAVASGFTGVSRPANLQAGGYWVDTSQEGTPNFKWVYKVYTGTTDITVFTINLSTGSASFAGADDLFQLSKISGDATGPIFKFLKSRVANNGQVLLNDVVGEVRFGGKDDTGAETTVARIRTIAIDNQTSSAQGSYLVIETTPIGQATAAEIIRFYNGRIGIGGVSAPTHIIHAKATNGSRIDRESDDAGSVEDYLTKSRVAGTGAVQSGDEIGKRTYGAKDSASAITTVAQTVVSATENHTASAKGTQWLLQTILTGTSALVNKIRVGNIIELFGLTEIEALRLTAQSIATTATITQLNSDKCIVNFTGSTDTLVQGLNSGGVSKTVLIHNGSTGKVTIAHQNVTATAADRFKLAKSKDIVLLPDQSVEVFYSASESRWKLKSGSGGGGGELTILTAESLADGATIALSTVEARQLKKVASSGSTGVLSSTPFGSFAGTDPVEVILVGDDNTNTLFLPYNDAAFGCVGNFESEGQIEISKNLPVKALWYPATQRFYVSRGV